MTSPTSSKRENPSQTAFQYRLSQIRPQTRYEIPAAINFS